MAVGCCCCGSGCLLCPQLQGCLLEGPAVGCPLQTMAGTMRGTGWGKGRSPCHLLDPAPYLGRKINKAMLFLSKVFKVDTRHKNSIETVHHQVEN